MPFQDQAGRHFSERGTKEPTACSIQLSALLKRFDSQNNGAVTLRSGEEGHRLPECLDASIGAAQEGQIWPGNTELGAVYGKCRAFSVPPVTNVQFAAA